MTDELEKAKKEQFLYPTGNYYGKFTPQHLAFNANLQEFAQKSSYLCALESNGKITAHEAYHEIKKLWKQLKNSKLELLGDSPLPHEELPPDE
jgi:hypothetical protein